MANFALSFKKYQNKTEQQIDKIIRGTALDLTSAIILDTPVDTGRAKGNWQVSIDQTKENELSMEDKSGSPTISKAKNELSKPIGRYIYIQNNLPYIERLEYGWSSKAPEGMVRRNIIKFNKFLTSNARKTK